MQYNDVVGSKCGNRNLRGIRVVCQEFYNAVRRGEIEADTDRGGWTWSEAPLRQMTFDTKWAAYQQDRDVDDHTGERFLFAEACMFCGGALAMVSQRSV